MDTATIQAFVDAHLYLSLAGTFAVGLAIGLCIRCCGCCPRNGRKGQQRRKPLPQQPMPPVAPGDVELYVGNLSYDTTEDGLRKEFERFGAVKSARIITNRFNSKSKGFGFVIMPNRPEAEAAIKAMNDRELQGRKLRVNEARNSKIPE